MVLALLAQAGQGKYSFPIIITKHSLTVWLLYETVLYNKTTPRFKNKIG